MDVVISDHQGLQIHDQVLKESSRENHNNTFRSQLDRTENIGTFYILPTCFAKVHARSGKFKIS
jgi:hypothetical protein